ncbi:MAG: hypothetical protein WDW38_001797 [Sanguina aurantia]
MAERRGRDGAPPGPSTRSAGMQGKQSGISPLYQDPLPTAGRVPLRKKINRTILQEADSPADQAYWTNNRWGPVGKTQQTPGAVLSPAAKRAKQHYQPPQAPLTQPAPEVFATLNGLETLMRASLGALANFNEDERMIVTKQFRREEDRARLKDEGCAPGLLTNSMFRHAWRKFSVRVTEEQATALFIKHGCDRQGLLPYDLFAAKLLTSSARTLALEPEQKEAYVDGRNATFRGKILYKYCRKPVFPPSNWDGTPALRSSKRPKAHLELEFVYGYAGINTTSPNLFYAADGRVVYYIAALAVIYDPVTHLQSFFQAHDDDIHALAMHPNRTTFATGQTASAMEGHATECPSVLVWDIKDLSAVLTRLKFPADGNPARFIAALGFSGDGTHLVVVTADNRHTVYIYLWRSRKLINSDVGYNGQPPSVYGVTWNNFIKDRDATGQQLVRPAMFATYGVKHVKFWSQTTDSAGKELYSSVGGKFGKTPPGDVMSAIFISSETLVTGAQTGQLLLWDVGGRRAAFGSLIQVVEAHGLGSRVPSIHNGAMVLGGVRALTTRHDDTELLSGGSDGVVIVWDITGGHPGAGAQEGRVLSVLMLGRVVHSMPGDRLQTSPSVSSFWNQLLELGEDEPCSISALDCHPTNLAIIAGTNRSDIWEVAREVPEVLMHGHTDDVYGIAWHPKKPHRMATASKNNEVIMWNTRTRQLIAKVKIGVPAQCVAFSPNGAHLAVGCETGMVKVLMVEALTQKVAEAKNHTEQVSEVQYSPDGSKLATGSHDNAIDIYDVQRGYVRIARCKGHSSYITHMDWSTDSRTIQSNCGAFELLYWEASTGKQIRQDQRDTLWENWTCTLGFPVMGVWRRGSDVTEVEALHRSNRIEAFARTDPLCGEGQYVVTASDDGRIRLMNFPAVVQAAPCREYVGHSSHVMDVRFSPDNRAVVSVGGRDRAILQWRVDKQGADRVVHDAVPLPEVYVFQNAQRQVPDIQPVGSMPNPQAAASALQRGALQTAVDVAARDAERKAALEAAKLANTVRYEISTITSDVKGAGCDSSVTMVVYGSKGYSPQLALDNNPANFQRCNRLRSAPLHVRDGLWFAADVGDKLLSRILLPEGSRVDTALGGPPPIKRYRVQIKTSDIKGAGTDAKVSLTMFGEQDGKPLSSGPMPLENSHNNFERSMTDTFDVAASIGTLKSILIGHDNSGAGPGWHLSDVVIGGTGMLDLQFVANRWLGTDMGDGKTNVLLYPVGATNVEPSHKYKILVYTSHLKGAGTDANVTICLYGSNGLNSGMQKLDTHKNNFERNTEDLFFLDLPYMGDVIEIDIGHDNSGIGPGWHLSEVVVFDETANKRAAFSCDRWLATTEDDHQIRRRLKVLVARGESTNYTVTTYTSDIKGAGTDAAVFVQFSGEKDGKAVTGPRETLAAHRENFEKAKVDTFVLMKHRNMGALSSIKIGHDNSGLGSGWHLDHVEVVDEATGVDYFFPCGMWLDKKEGDGKIERDLPVALRDLNAVKCMYKVTVHTSDLKFAGTDANVFVEMLGERDGQPTGSGRQTLNNSKNNYERAAVDVFTLTAVNLGALKRIVIGHDNSGLGAAWHLQQVEVLCVNTDQQCTFYYNDWLSKSDAPYKLEVELFPLGVDGNSALCRQLLACMYSITTYTSDERGAGTDANVSAMLMGDKANSSILQLNNSSNNFERGQRDEFIVESVDVGQFLKLQIGHDNKGLGPAWKLDHVEVVNQATLQRAYFIADCWLDAKMSSTTITLLAVTDAVDAKQRYKVSIRTGDKKGAGTDSDISVMLIGADGSSKETKLESHANNFERSKLDEFELDLGQLKLGEIQKVDIGYSTAQTMAGGLGGLFGKAWALESVEVLHFNTGSRTFFMYDDWLSGERRRVQLVPGKVGENNTYKCAVRTSDLKGAGTDSTVTITLFGSRDGASVDSGAHKLDGSHNDFERNATDTFHVKCKDLAALTRIVVEVTDTIRGLVLVFPCGAWLSKSDIASLTQTLLPAGGGGESVQLLQYDVSVYTSDIRGAGIQTSAVAARHTCKPHAWHPLCEAPIRASFPAPEPLTGGQLA